jgi:tetratricopeptide (TPR) repeat protein
MNEKDLKKIKKDNKTLPTKSLRRWLIIFLIVLVALMLMFLLTKPLRTYSANKYIEAGNKYLVDKQYLHADLAYEKALTIFPKNKETIQNKALAQEASENVLKLESFYNDNGFRAEEQKLNEATAFPENETEAVKLSKKLIEEGEYQLATIPAQTATEMDSQYRDAWLYLGIANLETAQLVELKTDVQKRYFDKAKEALEKAKNLDPEYAPTKEFLNQLQK